jgi:hypothetical protein
MKNE